MSSLYDIMEKNKDLKDIDGVLYSIDVIGDFLDNLASSSFGYKEEITNLLNEVEDLVNKYTTFEMAKKAVDELEDEDGNIGEKWSIEQIEETLKNKKIPLQNEYYNLSDMYYLINMVYSNHSKTFNNNIDLIINTALDLAEDIDFPSDKVSYAKAHIKWKEFLSEKYK